MISRIKDITRAAVFAPYSGLTGRAPETRPAAEYGSSDRGAACAAFVPFSAIHLEALRVFACATIREQVGKIVQAGSSIFEPGPEYRSDRGSDRLDLVRCQAAGRPVAPDPGPGQHLVGVNIPKSGQETLIEKQRFDSHLAARHPIEQDGGTRKNVEGIRTEATNRRVVQFIRGVGGDKAKRARVDQANLHVSVGGEHDVGVFVLGIANRLDLELPRHPQVHDERDVSLDVTNHELANSPQVIEPSSDQSIDDVFWSLIPPRHARASNVNLHEASTFQDGHQ